MLINMRPNPARKINRKKITMLEINKWLGGVDSFWFSRVCFYRRLDNK